MEEPAYAKINLALHVRAREPDGYHRLETLFAFAEHGDLLRVEKGEALTLAITGAFAEALGTAEDNLVLRAARALQERFELREGAALTLDKSLPVAAGIGGGSADAAAALRLLVRWWGLEADETELLEIAAALGADVPACLVSRTVRGEGRGDRLVPGAQDLAGTPLLLVNPRVPLSTAAVFRAWDGLDRGALGDFRTGRNDLESPARGLVPQVAEVLEALSGAGGATLIRMSGSGATCFALFESDADRDAAAAALAADRPHWWLLPTRLR
jgi:4-diphosphocytidyl-2-C-methyl-D-erythritol kinase